jgi:uncharacterized protein YacL
MAKTCNGCGTNDMAVMPIAQHEKDQNRLMGIIKWLIAVIVILVMLFVGYIALDKWRDSQYEVVEEKTEETIIEGVTQETEGGDNNFIGGDYTNGETND